MPDNENKYEVLALSELLEEFERKNIEEVLNDFTTIDVDKDVEDFLRHKAIDFQIQDFSRTYLVFLKIEHVKNLVGYFSIINKPLNISAVNWNALSGKTRSRLVGKLGNAKIDGASQKSIPGILLGQLGKDNKYSEFVPGSDILKLAEIKVKDAWRSTGGRLLWLEANYSSDSKLMKFYETNKYIKISDNKGEPLLNQNGQVFFIKVLSKIE